MAHADSQPLDFSDLEAAPLEAVDLSDESNEVAGPAARLPRRPSLLGRDFIQNFGAMVASMVVHLLLLIVLGVMSLPPEVQRDLKTLVSAVFEEREEDPVVMELEEDIEAVTEETIAVVSSSPMAGITGGVSGGPTESVNLDQKVVAMADTPTEISITPPTLQIPSSHRLIEAVPDGEFKGEARAIVDDYQQAMDRITQELMWMLDKGNVLVIWCFDQSESMKDDQQEIRLRINRIFGRAHDDVLTTSVVSYGQRFATLTRKPTSDLYEIRSAIESVPVDPSGKEVMCQAVGYAIAGHREYCAKTNRQMALVLVTDESGDRDNNARYLEAAIAEAKAAKCRVYALGREAVFGYPYAYMRWKHPETKRIHWLQVDRGPETGFVEQLQTDGFRRRYDAFSSGFGPYEQTRLARETGGIFFMLPSMDTSIVRGEKRRYELEAMRNYRPDLRARIEVLADRDEIPLRMLLWQIITDLNPYSPQAKDVVEIRHTFSRRPDEFQKQVNVEIRKSLILLKYFGLAQEELEKNLVLREKEPDPRWQANFDLMHAQLIAYQARIYEYGAALEDFMRHPQVVPLQKPPNLTLVHWDISTHGKTLTQESQSYIERASQLFNKLIEDHPGTPWAERARWELRRGFGVKLVPDYDPPHPPASGRVQIPKL